MKKILAEIQSGEFARGWINENKTSAKKFNALRESEKTHQVEEVGANLRGMMSWIKKDKNESAPKKQVVNA